MSKYLDFQKKNIHREAKWCDPKYSIDYEPDNLVQTLGVWVKNELQDTLFELQAGGWKARCEYIFMIHTSTDSSDHIQRRTRSHVATFFQQCGIRATNKRTKSSSPAPDWK